MLRPHGQQSWPMWGKLWGSSPLRPVSLAEFCLGKETCVHWFQEYLLSTHHCQVPVSGQSVRDRVSTEGLGKTDVVWLTVDHRSLFYRRSVCALLALLSMTPGQIPCLGRACCRALVTGSKYYALLWVCSPTFQGRLLPLPHLVTAPCPTPRTSVSFPPAAASDFSSSTEHSQLPRLRTLPSVAVSGLCCFAIVSSSETVPSAHTGAGAFLSRHC